MVQYTPDSLIDEIESLKNAGHYMQALKKVNHILIKDPHNEEALLQVTDIQYRQWEISKAAKAIDFLNSQKNNTDPLWLYIKGVLEMEKNNWKTARIYLTKAITLTNNKNHEIMRCYWLTEYWYGNREKWLEVLEDAFILNDRDAELIYNLIELYLLERHYKKARKFIKHYYAFHDQIQTIDKDIDYYDMKILLFEKFIDTQKFFDRMNKK
jgi:tetratricopeptide (TPR) repeat protein